MNTFYFLDIFMFVFLLQYVFYFKEGMLSVLVMSFLDGVKEVFSYEKKLPLGSSISIVIFLILLVSCFGGYFTYSFCPCGMLEFTLIYAVVAWLSTLMTYVSSEKFSVYMSKGGDVYLKSLAMMAVEVMSEFSRPLALTVRLTVNIMVGHLISMMLYYFIELSAGWSYLWLVIFAIMMECFVFCIQSYIFSRLVFLYLNE